MKGNKTHNMSGRGGGGRVVGERGEGERGDEVQPRWYDSGGVCYHLRRG